MKACEACHREEDKGSRSGDRPSRSELRAAQRDEILGASISIKYPSFISMKGVMFLQMSIGHVGYGHLDAFAPWLELYCKPPRVTC